MLLLLQGDCLVLFSITPPVMHDDDDDDGSMSCDRPECRAQQYSTVIIIVVVGLGIPQFT